MQSEVVHKNLSDALNALAGRLKADPDSDAALKALYDLCAANPGAIDGLIKAYPNLMPLRSVAVALCRAANEHVQRLKHLEALYKHGFRGSDFYFEYARMLSWNGQYERCIQLCNEGLAQDPNAVELMLLRGQTSITLGRHAEALKDSAWVVARTPAGSPQSCRARTAIGMIKILTSNGEEGYEDYAAQRDEELAKHGFNISIPEWRGEALAGKHIFLWCSQGIGDIIMFGSLLPWVLAQGARATLALYPKLIPLFARSFPEIRIIPHTKDMFERYGRECDCQAVLGQLMGFALPHYTPSQHPHYLKADTERARQLRQKYSGSGKKLIGISWHTTNQNTFSQRNIPLKLWQPLFALPNVQFVSLQYGEFAEPLPEALLADPTINAYEDTDGLAAQITAMDEVISIQNSTVHLAGALGVKTTLLLSAASDWRWGLGRADNRWYKSVTIERQEKLLEWEPVMKCVRDRLA